MKRIKVYLGGLLMMIATGAFAQQSPAKEGIGLSIGVDGGIPLGTFHSTSKYKFGIGGDAKLAIPVAKGLDVTLGAGYMAFSHSKINELDNSGTFTIIPFKGGLRYRTPIGVYIEPQAGFTQTKIKNQEGSGQFAYAVNLGYMITNVIDLSVGYNAINARDNVDGTTIPGVSAKFLGLRVAYNFRFAKDKQ